MIGRDALLAIHERVHRNVADLLERLAALPEGDLRRPIEGFGYPTIHAQLCHVIQAEAYWIGVLRGLMLSDDRDDDFPTLADIVGWRAEEEATTAEYLRGATDAELNAAGPFTVYGGAERMLVPAMVVMRPITHYYQHMGQIVAMTRMLGSPAGDLGFPVTP